jgi:hypothetical protein
MSEIKSYDFDGSTKEEDSFECSDIDELDLDTGKTSFKVVNE